jgi:predicted RecB family nuclease
LSLLRGIGEKTIKRYARKGLLTLNQLAHTFRPRRRGKRADAPLRLRDHALHALAIRDQTIYVLGAPKLPTAPMRIYLDIESDSEEGFTYLIVLVVCDGERVERQLFWSDDRNGEAAIFGRFLAIVARYDAPRIYWYGNYERAFIARMRRQVRRKKCVDTVLAALTNVLTIVYRIEWPTSPSTNTISRQEMLRPFLAQPRPHGSYLREALPGSALNGRCAI